MKRRLVMLMLAGLVGAQTPGKVTRGVTVTGEAGKMVCIFTQPDPTKVRVECAENGARRLQLEMAGSTGIWSNGADTVSWSVNGNSYTVTANGITGAGNF